MYSAMQMPTPLNQTHLAPKTTSGFAHGYNYLLYYARFLGFFQQIYAFVEYILRIIYFLDPDKPLVVDSIQALWALTKTY
jgi:hypothetical protein